MTTRINFQYGPPDVPKTEGIVDDRYFFQIALNSGPARSILLIDENMAHKLLEVFDSHQQGNFSLQIDGCAFVYYFQSEKMHQLRDALERKLLSKVPLDGVFPLDK